MDLSNLLFHPVRVILSLTGVILALIAWFYFASPFAMMPTVLLISRFVLSGERYVTGIGVVLLLLFGGCQLWQPDHLPIEDSEFGRDLVYVSLAFMLLSILHLWLSSRSVGSTAS
jgi:hypothetical protein